MNLSFFAKSINVKFTDNYMIFKIDICYKTSIKIWIYVKSKKRGNPWLRHSAPLRFHMAENSQGVQAPIKSIDAAGLSGKQPLVRRRPHSAILGRLSIGRLQARHEL
ncbi:hypothetical protein [Acidisphaera sp. S103]|uniref:hypothetical protein n=1 Tax=Acidisphaera sp. S103 TaxID=1747223 RepID=UPI00131B427D|nr:hypothetical protein [Acidisphaera sp. S103]